MNSTPMLNQLLFNQMNNSSQNINFPQYKSTQNTQSIFPNLLKMIELKKNLNTLNVPENINNPFPQNNSRFFPINFPVFSMKNQKLLDDYDNSESSDSESSDSDCQSLNNSETNVSDNSNNTKENSEKSFNGKKSGDTIDFKTKWKTEKCHYWEMYGKCKFGENCAFAHGDHELKKKTNLNVNYKTKPCKQFFEEGYCNYGTRCQFSHKKEVYNEFHHIEPEKKINYNNIIYDLLTKGKTDISAITRPRLFCFEKLVNCSMNENIENRLLFYQDVLDLKNLLVHKSFVYKNFK